jgi:phenylacetate-coenzyme A ligase PaaK-like adenylate-forming protein
MDGWIAKKISEREFRRGVLEAYQLDRINRTLAHAAEKSAFYRERFGGARLDSLRSLESLPFTTPEDLRADPYRMLCVHPNEISRIVTLQTSGSTGAAKRVFFTDADLELCTDYFHHGMRNLVDETDTVGILFPYKTPASVGDQLIKGLGRLGVKTEPLFGLSNEEISRSIESNQITSLAGMPGQIAGLAKLYPRLSTVKTVLLSADFVSCEVRKTIRDAWGAEVFEHYGMTEMGLGCAVSCESQIGYHVREADLYLEIIDPDTGAVLPDGEWGEIVFTTLTRIGMPFIRYRTGDISRWKTGPCPCGTSLKLLDYIRDRKVVKGRVNA